MSRKLRRRAVVVLIAGALSVSACSSDTSSEPSTSATTTNDASPSGGNDTSSEPSTSATTTDDASPTADSNTSSAAAATDTDAAPPDDDRVCALLTTEEVEAAVDEPVKITVARAQDTANGLQGNCTYFASDNLTGVTVVVFGTSVPKTMFDAMTRSRAKEAQAVSGLGEEAVAIPFGPGGAGLVTVYDHGILLILSGQKAGGLSTDALVDLTRTALSRSSSLQ